MLTPQDDLLGHQLPTTFDHVVNSDQRWTERYWYTGHPVPGGEIIFDIGLGYYPNRNVMDVFAGVTIGRTQHNFRGSRRLRPNPLDTKVGPLQFEIVEGMRKHRVRLAPNDSGITFDLTFHATMEPAEERQSYRRRNGWLEEDLVRMTQFGRWEGWLEIDGQRYIMDRQNWWGQRDHSWGVRTELKTDRARPPMQAHKNFFWMWAMYQFEDFGICLFAKERAPGVPIYLSGTEVPRLEREGGGLRHVAAFTHDLRWAEDPFGQTLEGGVLVLKFEDGGQRELRFECLPARYYLKAGLYGGLNGWDQGEDKGREFLAHDRWDLDDADTRSNIRTLSDHVCRITCDGQVGYGINEYGVGEGYVKYPGPQRFPAL